MTKDGGKKRTAWEIWGWVSIGVGVLVFGYGIWYMKCAADPDWWGSLWKEDKDIVSTGRGIAAAGMGIVGMGLVAIRISKQNEQLDKQDEQLAEQQSNNYLTKLHHGMDQLVSKHNLKQLIGAEQLHLLAEAGHKDHVSEILKTYCSLLRETKYNLPKDIKEDDVHKEIRENEENRKLNYLKNRILGYIIQRGGIYVSKEINLAAVHLQEVHLLDANLQDADLRRADLRRADLRCAHLRRADLRRADLRDANLRRADLRRADLRDANLRRADLQDAHLEGADLRDAHLQGAHLQGANLEGAIMPSKYKAYIAKQGVKEEKLIIWYDGKNFEWQNEKGLTHKALIEKLRSSGLLSKNIISAIINHL